MKCLKDMNVLTWKSLVNEEQFQGGRATYERLSTEPPAVMSQPVRLKVAIPHFFNDKVNGASSGYGSSRASNRFRRSLSLGRCVGSILGLQRASRDWILNIAERQLELTPVSTRADVPSIEVELHIFVTGSNWLKDTLNSFLPRFTLHQLELEDPRQLPLETISHMLALTGHADLFIYAEDDLVISDPFFVDKLKWFYQRTQDKFILMPHRFELAVAHAPQKLYVDGPIKTVGQQEQVWSGNESIVAQGRFRGEEDVSFVEATNPHSGFLCVSASQFEKLRLEPWPPPEFVSPLETAATGTVLGKFPILKPSWPSRDFLTVEHANPSFLSTLDELPKRGVE